MLCFAATIPLSAKIGGRFGSRNAMVVATLAIFLFGIAFAQLFASGSLVGTFVFLAIGMCLTGLTYGPVGTLLAGMFPTAVRYTGASLCFNLSGILVRRWRRMSPLGWRRILGWRMSAITCRPPPH